MNRKYVNISVIALTILSLACIEEKPRIIDSARIDLLPIADIKIDGMDSDWGDILPVYEDSEKSMFAVIDNEYLVIRIDLVELRPFKERYFIGIDTDYDELMDYKIEFSKREERVTLEKRDCEEWKEVESDIEGDAVWTVEIKIPLADLDSEGFFLTGWVYDTSVKNITSHFPWIRSLYPEADFDAELTKNEWKEDFEALCYIIEYNYPYLWVKERTHGYNWLDLREEYIARLEKIETNEEFLDLIIEMVQTLQNGHTQVVSYEYLKKYKEMMLAIDFSWSEMLDENVFEANEYWGELWNYSCPEVFFYYFKGDYIAIGGLGNWKEKYGIEEGSKVVEVNGIDVDEAVKSLTRKTHLFHDCDRDKLFMVYLDPHIFGENTILTTKNPDTITKIEIQYVSENPEKEIFRLVYGERDPNLEFKKWEDKKTAYIRIRSLAHENIEQDEPKLLEFYRTIEDYNTLIIDIRGNGGGADMYWKENIVSPLAKNELEAQLFYVCRQGKYVNWLRPHIKSAPKETIARLPSEVRTNEFIDPLKNEIQIEKSNTPFNGEVYLLVDRWVYSAAESFAAFTKASGFAELVGNTTGGDGLCGSPLFFILPNSRLVIRIASSMGINPDGTANEETHTTPDIYFEQSEWDKNEEIIEYLLEEIINW